VGSLLDTPTQTTTSREESKVEQQTHEDVEATPAEASVQNLLLRTKVLSPAILSLQEQYGSDASTETE
jgi:hypothetical protein